MAIDLGETESETRVRDRRATDMLLSRLVKAHSPKPSPRKFVDREKSLPPIPNSKLAVAHQFFPVRPPPISQVEAIQRAVLMFYPKITMNDLKSARRTDNIVRPRQIAMYLAKTLTPRSLPDIGRRFGGRDHSTILHAVRKIAGLIETDPETAKQIRDIKEILGEQASMKQTPISEILRRIRPLAKQHQAAHLRGVIASEQGHTNGKPNIHKTSVRIRELQAALQDVMTKQLRKEGRAA